MVPTSGAVVTAVRVPRGESRLSRERLPPTRANVRPSDRARAGSAPKRRMKNTLSARTAVLISLCSMAAIMAAAGTQLVVTVAAVGTAQQAASAKKPAPIPAEEIDRLLAPVA